MRVGGPLRVVLAELHQRLRSRRTRGISDRARVRIQTQSVKTKGCRLGLNELWRSCWHCLLGVHWQKVCIADSQAHSAHQLLSEVCSGAREVGLIGQQLRCRGTPGLAIELWPIADSKYMDIHCNGGLFKRCAAERFTYDETHTRKEASEDV
eukprot:2202014-Amphidinium_carterae.1